METSTDKKILLVVPQAVVRTGLSQMIGVNSKMKVCAEAGTLEQARRTLARQDVDLVIVTVEIEGGNGYRFLKELVSHKRKIWPVAYGHFQNAASVNLALLNGAKGVISIDDSAEEVLSALTFVTAGRQAITKINAELLVQAMSEAIQREKNAEQKPLAPREQQLYEMLGSTMKLSLIAEKMGLSPKTLNTMIHRIETKKGLKSTLDLRLHSATDLSQGKQSSVSALTQSVPPNAHFDRFKMCHLDENGP
jgi:DNA-binding NarL/FixJ family response regulator